MRRRAELAFLVICILANAAVLYFVAFPLASIWLGGDEGAYVYQVQRILDGQVIYRDFFQGLGPGFFLTLAAWAKLAGLQVVTFRMLMLLFMLLTSLLSYGICRRLGVSPFFSIVASVAFSVLKSRNNVALNHYNLSMLLEVSVLLLMIAYAARPSRPALFLSGILVSADILTSQHLGFVLFCGSVLVILFVGRTYRRGAWSHLLLFAAGCAPFALGYLGYALWTHSLGAMYRCTVVWVFQAYAKFDTRSDWFGWLGMSWNGFRTNPGIMTLYGMILELVESFAAPVAVLVDGAWLMRHWRRCHSFERRHLAFGAAGIMAGCLYLGICASPTFLVRRVTLAGLLLSYALWYRLYERWRLTPRRFSLATILSPVGISAVLFCTAVPFRTAKVFFNVRKYLTTIEKRTLPTPRGTIWLPVVAENGEFDTFSYLAARVPAGSNIYVLNWSSWIYYFGGYHNPGPSEVLLPIFTSEEIVRQTISAIERSGVEWLVQDSVIHNYIERGDSRFQCLRGSVMVDWSFRRYRDAHFRPVARFGDFTIYRRKG